MASSTVNVGRQSDMNHLLTSLAGNLAMARKLARLFLEMQPKMVSDVEEALGDWDLERLRRVVHNIRGSCTLFSAEQCLTLTRKLEGDLPDRPGPHLVEECSQLCSALGYLAQELEEFVTEEEA